MKNFGILAVLILIGIVIVIVVAATAAIVLKTGSIGGSGCLAEYSVEGAIVSEGSAPNMFSDGVKGSADIAADLMDIDKRDNVKGLFLVVNSPGGGVYATKEIFDVLKNYSKPIIVYIKETGASGGYYISLPAKKIIAHPDSIVGSIGVRIDHTSLKGLFDKIGINSTVFKSGKYKDVLSESRELNEDDLKIVNGLLDDIFYDFKSDVLKFRGSRITDPDAYEAKIYTGRLALKAGLVDDIGSLDYAKDQAYGIANVSKDSVCDYNGNRLKSSGFFAESVYGFGKMLGKGLMDGFSAEGQTVTIR